MRLGVIRSLIILFEVIILFLLQSTVFTNLALAGVVPDLLIILVISVAFTRGKLPGMFAGLLCGLITDFCYGDFVGLCAIFYLLIGYIAGFSNKIYDENDYTLPIILIGVSELVYNLMYYIFNFLLRGKLNIGYYFFRFMIPRVIYTVLISILLYKLFNLINIALRRLDKDDVI